jgi:hypothetical protein
MKTYNVSVGRDAPNWTAELKYEGTLVFTASTWPGLYDLMRRVLADKGAGEFEEDYTFEVTFSDSALETAITDFHKFRRQARSANESMERALRAAARAFTDASSTRDAGAILGYSHQYISKITQATR